MIANLLKLTVAFLAITLSNVDFVLATVTLTTDQANGYHFTAQAGYPDYILDHAGGDFMTFSGNGENQAFRVDQGVSIQIAAGTYPRVGTEYVWINDPDHGGGNNWVEFTGNGGQLSFVDVSYLWAQKVYFGRENNPIPWSVVVWESNWVTFLDCEFHCSGEARTCLLWDNRGDGQNQYLGPTLGKVQNCKFWAYGVWGKGIVVKSFTNQSNQQLLDIFGCRITLTYEDDILASEGFWFERLYGQAAENDEADCPVRVYNNIITGTNATRGVFINNRDGEIKQRSLLIRNNIIQNCNNGILIGSWDEPGDCFPLIYNNAIFNIAHFGIYLYLQNLQGDQYSGIRIRNNIIWGEWDQGETIYGLQIIPTQDAGANDIDLANNIIGNLDYGCSFNDHYFTIHHNAFKNMRLANAYFDGENVSAEALSGDCVIDEPNGGEHIALLNENPSNNDWDFHIVMDDIRLDPLDFNLDLANPSGDNHNGWMDPPTRNVARSGPDYGIFGGPYAKNNITPDLYVPPNWDWIQVGDLANFRRLDRQRRMPPEFYRTGLILAAQWPGIGEEFNVPAGVVIDFGENVLDLVGDFQVEGEGDSMGVEFIFDGGYLSIPSSFDLTDSYFNYCRINNAPYGLYLSGVTSSGSDRLEVSNCTFTDCGVGVYANNSRLHLLNTTITGSTGIPGTVPVEGNGVYLTSCSSGKVKIENCTISNNATSTTVAGAGVFLSSSSPEMIYNTIADNAGCGIHCSGSSPDLNTYYSSADHPNTIQSNGATIQSGSDGAEIYLASSSYPAINYNNVIDGGSSPVGYMVYKHQTTNASTQSSKDNWWGATPNDGFFYWGSGTAINYSSYEGDLLSSVEQFDIAMGLWDEGDFEGCAAILEETVYDTGAVGINSVHYLAGCVGEMSAEERQVGNLSYPELRELLQDVAGEHQDAEVARVANRFATDCLTSTGDYEGAMEEYDAARENAVSLSDSVMAVVDYLAVYELANGHEADASGKSVQAQMGEAFAALERGCDRNFNLPTEFAINAAYPNPFNSTTRIAYALPEAVDVKVTIHDVVGRQVAELASGRLEAGQHTAVWTADAASAGLYFCKVVAGGNTATTKVMLVK